MAETSVQNGKGRQLRFLSQSVRLEESVNPRIVRLTNWTICLSILAFFTWACITSINEVARAPGEVAPQGMTQVVQHLEGGLVMEIIAHEGQVIEKDQVVMILDGAGVQQDQDRARSEKIFLGMQRERLKSFIEDRNPDFSQWEKNNVALVADQVKIFESMKESRGKEREILMDQISQKKQAISTLNSRAEMVRKNLVLAQDVYDRKLGLYQQGFISHINFIQNEQQLNDLKGERNVIANEIKQVKQEIAEYESRLKSLDASRQEAAWQDLNKIEAQIAQNDQILEKMDRRVARLEVRAPVRGLIKSLNVNTIGAVVQPGQSLMEIVPLDAPLVVDVRIPPQHIGHLKVGIPVQVKVSTFDFSRYGAIPGKLDFISPSTFMGERGDRFYRGRVVLERNYVGDSPERNIIMPGMTVMADMITGEKTVMAYLMKPINNAMKTAFTER